MRPLDRRTFLRRCAGLAVGVTALGAAGCSSATRGRDESTSKGTTMRRDAADDPATIAREAFIAGFPLVTTVRTMQTFARLVGVNRLFVGNALVEPTSRLVVAPNRDTLYALAVLDLRDGPLVLTLPDIPSRYHVFQFIDAWMGGFGLLGTRATGGRAGSWAVVAPGDATPLPDGVERLRCPTNQAIVLGRIRAIDDADALGAAEIGRRATLEPLVADASGSGAPRRSMPAPVGAPQEVGRDGLAYFDELGDALAVNQPVTHAQREAITAAIPLGVGPGRHPGEGADRSDAEVLRGAVAAGLRELASGSGGGGRRVNGWDVNLRLGEEGGERELAQRAVVARYYWGPVPVEEAVYPRATVGSDGEPLDGAKRYRIHFSLDRLPPVDAFWSVTVYGPDMFLVPNAQDRYSLSGDTPGLVTGADGSIELLLQHEAPSGATANWLPVPDGPFNVIMRLYLPRAAIRTGTYDYPPVTVVDLPPS